MNYSTNQSSLCPVSTLIAQSPFSIILSFEIATGILAVIPNILLLMAVYRAKSYPANLRFLLINLSMCLVCQSCANTVKASIMLNVSLRDPCLLVISSFDCRVQDLVLNIVGANIFYALLAIGLERVYCAIRYRKHDYSSSSPVVANVLLFVMWGASVAGTAYSLPQTPKNIFMPICETALGMKAQDIAKPLIIAMAMEIVPLIMIFLVRAYDQYNLRNTAINRVQHTLNFRFQLIQSAQMNAVIVPSLVLHAICYAPTIILYLVVLEMELEIDTRWRFFHACTIYRLIYAFAHPALAFNRNPRLRQQLKKGPWAKMTAKVWGGMAQEMKTTPTNGVRHVNNLSTHFNVLENAWAAGPNKNR